MLLLSLGCATHPSIARAADVDRAELKQLGDELAQRYAALEDVSRAMPRDRFDPQAVIERVGRDPAKLAAWVRDETDPLPYRGALRGPPGVVMDRAGNSLDRSLLLAELLRGVGQSVRLASATLPADRAAELAKQIPDTRRHAPSITADGAVPPTLAAARRDVQQLTQQLLAGVGAAATAPDPSAANAAAAAETLTDHWWVQRREGDAWIDVDPASADFHAIAPAARTIDVPATASAQRLPLAATDCHEVELAVAIEFWQDGALKTERVLAHTIRPAETIDRDISLTHFAGAALADTELYKNDAASRQKLAGALVAQTSWMPVLRVGGTSITHASFTTGGQIDRNPKVDPRGQLAGGAMKVFGGGFDALGGGGGENTSSADVVTAQWIEYTIRAPGAEPQHVRRELFDLIGPAARSAGLKEAPAFDEAQKLRRACRMLGRTQILIQPCDVPGEFVDDQLARRALADRKAWLALGAGEFGTAADAVKILDRARGGAGSGAPLNFALARAALREQAGRTFIDRPNVAHAALWAEVEVDPKTRAARVALRERFDLAFTSTAAPLGFAERLAQGVADTVAEQLALGATSATSSQQNTAGLFAAATAAGKQPIVVRAAADAPGNLAADARARAQADVAAGHVLLLAALDNGRSGWWRIDPRTGQTVGVMDSGFHQGTTEYDVLQAEVDAQTLGVPWRVSAREYSKMSAREVMQLSGRNTLTQQEWLAINNLQQRILTCLNRGLTLVIF